MHNAGNPSRRGFSKRVLCVSGVVAAAVVIGMVIGFVGIAETPSASLGVLSSSADREAAANANGRFAIDLYQRLAATESEHNLFFSPFSISTVLTMAAEGAIDETREQMLDVLHVPNGGLEQFNRGQGGLQQAVVPRVPARLAGKLAALRAKLKENNERTEAMTQANRRQEAVESMFAGFRLTREISQLADYECQIANALWVERSYPIEPAFVSTVKPNYGMVVFPVDFKEHPDPARRDINKWVALQTNGRIRDLLPLGSITHAERLVLTNTVYFNAQWAEPFEIESTFPAAFQQANGDSFPVDIMMQENSKSASYGAFTETGELFPSPREIPIDMQDSDPSLYPDERGHQMLSLDYKGGRMQMILLLPRSAAGLSALEKSLSYERLQRWIGQLEHRTVHVRIPKFKLESQSELNEPLQSLGIVRPFTNPYGNPAGAQFDKLSSPRGKERPLFISKIVHKTYLDVSEFGTEAAAVTALFNPVGDGDFGLDRQLKTRPFVPIFYANWPFMFLIRDRETATILFSGRFVSPLLSPTADAMGAG